MSNRLENNHGEYVCQRRNGLIIKTTFEGDKPRIKKRIRKEVYGECVYKRRNGRKVHVAYEGNKTIVSYIDKNGKTTSKCVYKF